MKIKIKQRFFIHTVILLVFVMVMPAIASPGLISLPISPPEKKIAEHVEHVGLDIQEDMIAYNGTPALYFPYTDVGTTFSVRFTPLMACTLTYVEVVTYGGSGDVLIHVWDDSGGSPNNDLITPYTTTLNGNLSYQRVDITPVIDIGDNDFHVGVEYTELPPPYMTSDNDSVFEFRSQYKRPSDPEWQIAEHNICIRAFVRYYTGDWVAPEIDHTWRVLGFSEEGDHPLVATITDSSGVASAAIHYSTDGIQFVTAGMMNTEDDIWEGAIPAQPAGTRIYYYVTAVDSSPNANEAISPPTAPDEPYTMDIVEGYEIAYDDGSAEKYFVVDTSLYFDNSCAIRITPDEYPVNVILARAFVQGDSSIDFTINEVSGGLPGAVLPGGEAIEATGLPHGWAIAGWQDGPQIASGSFFVVLHWRPDSPGDPALGQDTSMSQSRSYWYSSTSGWNISNEGEWLMRAVVATATGIKEIGPDGVRPARFEILGNYPNPFNSSTEIEFLVPQDCPAGECRVTIELFNIAGQLVKTLFKEDVGAGVHAVNWDGTNSGGADVATGIYFVRLTSGEQVDMKKMLLLR